MLENFIFMAVSAFFLFFLLSKYLRNTFSPLYWSKRGFFWLPCDISAWEVLSGKKFGIDADLKYYSQIGSNKFAGIMEFGTPLLFVKDLDLVRDVFIKDFDHFPDRRDFANSDPILSESLFFINGQLWKGMRAFLSPTFTSGKIRKMFQHFERSATNLEEYIKTHPHSTRTGYEVKVADAVKRYASEVIASSVFGVDIDVFKNKDSEFHKMSERVGQFNFWRKIRAAFFINFPRVAEFFKLPFLCKDVSEFFSHILTATLSRREEGKARDYFVQLLIEAKKGTLDEEDDEDDAGVSLTLSQLASKSSIQWTDALVISQAMIFLAAGFDTVGNSLSIILYMLAQHADIQEKVFREVTDIMKHEGGKITYEGVSKMTYLDMVVAEVLRLYPAVCRLERKCIKDYTINGTKLVIPKGTVLAISAEAIHTDKQYYPDPLTFDPERFSAENKAKRSSYAYMPFGIGSRNCIAMRFALVEIKAVLAHVVYGFNVSVPDKQTFEGDPIVREVFGYRTSTHLELQFIPRV